MTRFNRKWLGCLLIAVAYKKILPASVRDEWDLTFRRKTVEVPHAVDPRKFDP